MFGLKQAAVIAYNQVIRLIEQHIYHPLPFTTGIWAHKTRRTKCCLCLDDFVIKFYNKDGAEHLLELFKK